MNSLEEQLEGVKSVAVAGHIKPDGDCVGSCLAAYNYIKEYHPDIDVSLYLEPIPNIFKFLSRSEEIVSESSFQDEVDLFLALDCGDAGRLGDAQQMLPRASKKVCIDHHISNGGFCDVNYVYPKASSTAELIFDLLPKERITKKIAECIYVGIIHDTGVFQFSSTSSKTMQAVGFLIDTGIDFSWIVDKTYVEKTYEQHLIMARALQKSRLHLGDRCISSIITKKDMEECSVLPKHLEGIVQELRATKGVEAAVFLYQRSETEYKISMRSSADTVNVAEICMHFGGGGHIRAAGASTKLPPEECLQLILQEVQQQLERQA